MTDPGSKGKGVRLPKRPYQAPKLTVHGKLQTLTQAKGGFFSDGASKPNTRIFVTPPS
jgi:hypothetical protein